MRITPGRPVWCLLPARLAPVAFAAAIALTACAGATATAVAVPLPAAVSCVDASQLQEQAVADRRRSDESTSDHEKIYLGNRASYFASLALVAELKCRVTLDAADEALRSAFDAAHKAQNTSSKYQRAKRWSEASFAANQAARMLIAQLPAASR